METLKWATIATNARCCVGRPLHNPYRCMTGVFCSILCRLDAAF
jgi:hypothetical protein